MTGQPSQETTLMVVLNVRKEAKDSFALWLKRMNETVSGFSGFLSLEMRSKECPRHTEWTAVQRFQTAAALEHWKSSSLRKDLLVEVKPYLVEGRGSEEVDSNTGRPNEYVTEVFVTKVAPGQHEAFRAWAAKIQQLESEFPGYEGAYLQAPPKGLGENWITILRFDTSRNLDVWLNSNQRKEILREGEQLMENLESHRVVSPFAGWFANLSERTGKAPPVWKQTMLVLLVLFPIVMFELKFLHLEGFNRSLATFIGNAISVTLVSWPMMPLVIYFLSWWLIPRGEANFKVNLQGIFVVLALYVFEIVILWRLL